MSTYEARNGHARTKFADGSRQRDRRREEAEARQIIRNKRTANEQLQQLNRNLGKGVGAVKERTRLHLLLEQPPKKAGSKGGK